MIHMCTSVCVCVCVCVCVYMHTYILTHAYIAGNKCVKEFVGSSGPVADWYSRMKSQLPPLKYEKSIGLAQ